jgi:hypothetical protein
MPRTVPGEAEVFDQRFRDAVRRFAEEIHQIAVHRALAMMRGAIDQLDNLGVLEPRLAEVVEARLELTEAAGALAPVPSAAVAKSGPAPRRKPGRKPRRKLQPRKPAPKSSAAQELLAKKLAALRKATAVRVACPYPGCANPGIRSLSNFCTRHFRSLGAARKKQLREAQKRSQAAKKAG